MSDNKSDDQIKNSILSTNEIVLGSSTSKSMATMYLNLAHSAGMAAMNAVTNQQHLNIIGSAAVAAGASGLLRTGLSDQIEQMTPNERLDYLQKLLTLSANPAADPSDGAASTTESGPAASQDDTSSAAPVATSTTTTGSTPAPADTTTP